MLEPVRPFRHPAPRIHLPACPRQTLLRLTETRTIEWNAAAQGNRDVPWNNLGAFWELSRRSGLNYWTNGVVMSGTVTTSVRSSHPRSSPRQGPLRVPLSSSTGVPLSRSTRFAGVGRLLATGLVVVSILSASTGTGSPNSSGTSGATVSWTSFRSASLVRLLPERRRWNRDERRPPVAYVAAGPPVSERPSVCRRGPPGRPSAHLPNDKSPRPFRLSRWTASPGSSGGSSLAARAPGLGRT